MIKLFVATPTVGTVADSQTYALRRLEAKYGDRIKFIYPEKCVRRIFHDFARNALVDEFIQSEADIMWFLDSDICPPDHVLDLITEHGDKWKVAGAPYPVFMTPTGAKDPAVIFCVYKGTDGKGMSPSDIPYEGVEFVDGLATGCLFMKREIFSKLSKPYFEFKFDPLSRIMTEGEDLGFCKKLQAQGIKFFTDYSMVCKHYKQVCLLEVNNYAVEYANKSIQRFDALIKERVEALQARAQAKKAQEKPASKLILPGQF